MRNLKTIFVIPAILAIVGFSACKKNQSGPQPTVNYSIAVSGDTVSFTNLTTGASTYKWDFNDGTTSTDKNPVHVYPHKGKYVPTLYAISASGVSAEGSTVIHISKTSPIRLNDNTLSDWDTLTANVYISGTGGGSFRKAKFDYDASYVYFYIEMNATVADDNIFDFYIDADNSASTGLLVSMFTSGGYDILLEGQMLLPLATAPIPFAPYTHTGAQTAFSFASLSVSDFYAIGTVVQAGPLLKFEGKIDRTKLGLTRSATRIGIVSTSSDWSTQLGTLPDQNTDSYLLNMPE
jgi:PKD domain-containing protein